MVNVPVSNTEFAINELVFLREMKEGKFPDVLPLLHNLDPAKISPKHFKRDALWLAREQIMEFIKQSTAVPHSEVALAETAAKVIPGSQYVALITKEPSLLKMLPDMVAARIRAEIEIPVTPLDLVVLHNEKMIPFSADTALKSLCEWMNGYKSDALVEQVHSLIEGNCWKDSTDLRPRIEELVMNHYIGVASQSFGVSQPLKREHLGTLVKEPFVYTHYSDKRMNVRLNDKPKTLWAEISCMFEMDSLPVIVETFIRTPLQIEKNLRFSYLEKKQLAVANLYDALPGIVVLVPSDANPNKNFDYHLKKIEELNVHLIHTCVSYLDILGRTLSAYKKRESYATKTGNRAQD